MLRWLLPAAVLRSALAQEPLSSQDTPVESSAPPAAQDHLHDVRWRTAATISAAVGGTLAYGKAKWWEDGFTGTFHTADEGWFGADTPYGGADKLGHAMFAYTAGRLLARGFEWAGNEPRQALKLGVGTAVGAIMAVEVLDGYSKQWHFSKEDAVFNLIGGGLAWWMETNPRVDALLDFRLHYRPSTGSNGKSTFAPFSDYSGQRYLLVFKAGGVPALRQQGLWRYLEVSVGYGARGFDDPARDVVPPSRHMYLGVALNLTELLRGTVYSRNASPSRTQRITETFFEFVQVPAAGVWADREIR